MAEYTHLEKHKPKGIARFEFWDLEGHDGKTPPWVDVVLANSSNKPYFNAALKAQAKYRQQQRIAAGKMNANDVEINRNVDRALYPKYVVKDWGNILSDEKDSPKFSEAECRKWFKSLPDHIFDKLRDFAPQPENFVADEVDEVDPGDGEQTGKS